MGGEARKWVPPSHDRGPRQVNVNVNTRRAGLVAARAESFRPEEAPASFLAVGSEPSVTPAGPANGMDLWVARKATRGIPRPPGVSYRSAGAGGRALGATLAGWRAPKPGRPLSGTKLGGAVTQPRELTRRVWCLEGVGGTVLGSATMLIPVLGRCPVRRCGAREARHAARPPAAHRARGGLQVPPEMRCRWTGPGRAYSSLRDSRGWRR